jgi:hypothetical protein
MIEARPRDTTRAADQLSWGQQLLNAWSVGALPAMLLPLLGIGLGPQGLSVLGPAFVSLLDPAVPVAIATMGTLAAFQMSGVRTPAREVTGAAIESAVTAGLVGSGLYLIMPPLGFVEWDVAWLVPAAAALCAACSTLLPAADPSPLRQLAARMRDLDLVLPAVLGALLLAWIRQQNAGAAMLLVAEAAAAAICVAIAGVLLTSNSSAADEHRVFGIAMILLLGGIADLISASSLVVGWCAGIAWCARRTNASEALQPALGYVQHLLVMLMLLVAGVRAELTLPLCAAAAAYVLLRTAGKVAGATLAADLCGAPRWDVTRLLLAPGPYGVALALSMVRGDGAVSLTLVTIVVLGSAGAQLLHSFAIAKDATP